MADTERDLREQIGALTNDLNQLSQLAALFMDTSADFQINNEFVQNFTERVQTTGMISKNSNG